MHVSPSCVSVQGANFNISSARLENREAVIADIDKYKPTNVLNCAGVTGRPNVDWCEDHKVRYNLLLACAVPLEIKYILRG
jgi:hypothetical protein